MQPARFARGTCEWQESNAPGETFALARGRGVHVDIYATEEHPIVFGEGNDREEALTVQVIGVIRRERTLLEYYVPP